MIVSKTFKWNIIEMAKIKDITIWYSQTMQPRQFESIRANCEITVSLEEWEDKDKVIQDLQNYVHKKVIHALPDMVDDVF